MHAMEYGVRDFAELLMEICVIGVICGYIPNGRKICVICGQVPGELESGLDQPDYGQEEGEGVVKPVGRNRV